MSGLVSLNGRVGAILVTLLVLGSVVAIPAIAASGSLDPAPEPQQNPYIGVSVTKDVHDLGKWGTGTAAVLKYEGNDGSTESLEAIVNTSGDEPYSFVPSDVDFEDASAFPVDKANVSVLDAAEWSTGSNATVADVNTANGVAALEVATSGVTNGGTGTATFSNFTATEDVNKRYLQVVYDVNTVDSGASIWLRAVDADGDYVELELENKTGEGFITQEQIGQLTVKGSGDGTLAEIASVKVVVKDGDATVHFSAMNADRLSRWSFGEVMKNTDSDDELETSTVYQKNTSGALSVTSLGTLGDAVSSGEIHGLTFEARFYGSLVDQEDADMSFTAADQRPSYESKVDLYYRLKLPAAYDLSYANAALKSEVKLPSSRYITVEYAEGTGDTAFADVSGWSAVTSNYDRQGKNVTLDNTIQPGTAIVVHAEYLLTAEEKDTLESGGVIVGPGMGGGSSGGFFSTVWGKIAGLFGAIGTALGLDKISKRIGG